MSAIHKKYHQLRKEVIKHLYFNKMLTLTELSSLTQKSLPLVTTTVNDLVLDGYVLEHGLAPSTGCRRALTFLLNQEKQRYIVSVAMDQLITRVVVYDMFNNIKMDEEIMALSLNEDPSELSKLVDFLRDYIERTGIARDHILGIGIGMPGFVSAEHGMNYTFFKLKGDISLRDHLTQEIGFPVFIDNDSSLIGLAEVKFGIAKDLKDVLVVNIGWGIGLGMVVSGNMFRGHNGYAGEFSHIPLSQSNQLCSCGKRGCLEVDTSLLVLVERAKSEIAAGVSSKLELLFEDQSRMPGDHFLEAARTGDPLAVSILSDAAFLIGKGLATLIHIMNPEMIVLGGRGAIAGKILMAPVQHAINEFCIPRLAEQTTIAVSSLTTSSELLGASILVMENCEFN